MGNSLGTVVNISLLAAQNAPELVNITYLLQLSTHRLNRYGLVQSSSLQSLSDNVINLKHCPASPPPTNSLIQVHKLSRVLREYIHAQRVRTWLIASGRSI